MILKQQNTYKQKFSLYIYKKLKHKYVFFKESQVQYFGEKFAKMGLYHYF